MSEKTQPTSTPSTELEASIEIAAEPAAVWKLVSDLPRLAEWSPQVVRTVVRRPLTVGSRMLNVNHQGWKVWPTTAKVVAMEPHRRVAFRITENRTVWSFELEPVTVAGAAGTRVVQRRETPHGVSALSNRLVDAVLGGQETFTADLREGMRRTLERVKAEAEG